MPAATAERMPPPCCGRSCRVAQPPGPAFIILCAARRCPRLCAFCMRGFLGGLCFLCGSAARRPVRLGGFLFLFLFLFLCGSAARWLCGSAARWLCGSVALRLGGSAARRLGGSAAWRPVRPAASAALLPLPLPLPLRPLRLCFLCGSASSAALLPLLPLRLCGLRLCGLCPAAGSRHQAAWDRGTRRWPSGLAA